MATSVCMGAMMMCTFGATPASLVVIRPNRLAGTMPMANILDNKPMANIPSFGMCKSPANPATKRPPPVLFTPAPCVPVTASPWVPGSKVLLDNVPALDMTCKLMCNWAGVIQIITPGQFAVLLS